MVLALRNGSDRSSGKFLAAKRTRGRRNEGGTSDSFFIASRRIRPRSAIWRVLSGEKGKVEDSRIAGNFRENCEHPPDLRFYFPNTAIPDPPFLNFSVTAFGLSRDRHENNDESIDGALARVSRNLQSRFHQLRIKNAWSVSVKNRWTGAPMHLLASRKKLRLVGRASRHLIRIACTQKTHTSAAIGAVR